MRARARRAAMRTATALARRSAGRLTVPGTVGVVLTVGGQPTELAECLASLREHDAPTDVVIVCVGDTDPSVREIVEHEAATHRNVRVLGEAPDLATARARGLLATSGEFVVFLDPDHQLTAHGLAAAVASLRGSGSAYALVAHRSYRRGHLFEADDMVRASHGIPEIGTTAARTPALLTDTHAAVAVLRRSWLRPAARDSTEFLGDDLTLLATAAAHDTCDVLDVVGVRLRALIDRGGPSHHAVDGAGLRATAAAIRRGAGLLEAKVGQAYVAGAIAARLQPFLEHEWYGDDAYWSTLCEVVPPLVALAGAELSPVAPAYQKALLHLIVDADRERFHAMLADTRPSARGHATGTSSAGVVVDFGVAGIPETARSLADHESRARAEVRTIDFTRDGVEIEGAAYLDNIPLDPSSSVALTWVADDGRELSARVTRREDPLADRDSGLAHIDVTGRGFAATTDPLPPGRWSLVAAVSEGVVRGRARAMIRPWVMAGLSPRIVGGHAYVVDHDDLQQLRVTVAPGTAVAIVTGGPDVVTIKVPGHAPEQIDTAALDPARDHPYPAAGDRPARSTADTALVGRRGGLVLRHPSRCATVEAVRFETDAAVARLRLGDASGWHAALRLGLVEAPGSLSPVGDGRFEARFPLQHEAWGRTGICLPSGHYTIDVRNDLAGEWFVAAPDPDLEPVEALLDDMRVRVEAFSPDRPGVRMVVAAPLADDELGARNQHLLSSSAARATADRPAVFFRAMFGEHTSGNGLGVHQELQRRGCDLDLVWAVADRSVPVPAGGVGVVEHSRAWYDAICRARYHMVDVHQVAWLRRPADQVLIQTMHGYPYKIMGHAWWEKMGNPVQEIGSLDRRTREWSVFVSPAHYATPLLREAFLDPAGADDVRVLETGYPRNDALVRPERAAIRQRTRQLLSIREDQTVVLYAPTFRDYLSAQDRSARSVHFFDPAQALETLPEHYVVLTRGHAFNARVRDDRARAAERLIDVTDYPDVNELILASDVGVLDYSSLRFDYVLSGNPMIFLVPDLEEYDRHRGGVIPYPPTAPGPWTKDTAETVAWLVDLPRLREEFDAARTRFRADYVELEDGHSAARLVDAVFVPRGDAVARAGTAQSSRPLDLR